MNNKLEINRPLSFFLSPYRIEVSEYLELFHFPRYDYFTFLSFHVYSANLKCKNENFFFFSSPSYSVPRVIDQDLERYEPLEEEDHQGVRVPFKLEETYDQSFRANNFNGTWKTDREILYSDNYVGDIRLFDVTTGLGTVLLDSSVTVRFTFLYRVDIVKNN